MNSLQDLHSLVSELESEYDEKKQIQILEQIGKLLLTQYEIRIDAENIIQPIRVEAYYYPFLEPHKFCDPCAHPSSRKIGAFGKLYFIENQFGYPGVDLCLSQGEYYLSFLIKNSQIGGKYFKQMDLYDRFSDRRKEIEVYSDVLQKKAEPLADVPVFSTSRVGLNTGKTKFAHAPLSFVIEINRKENGESIFDWEKGYGKIRTVADYMLCHPEEDRRAQCKKLIGYNSDEVLDTLKELEHSELENLVEELDSIKGQDKAATSKRIQVLQEIGKMLINNYKIAIDDVVAEPLLVEAYYFIKNENSEFVDYNCHKDPKQKGASRFGKLYFHNKGRGGVDICLPLGEYYLSFLIKVAKIGEETKKQVDIYDKLSSWSGIEDRGDILRYYPSKKDHCIVCMPRKNTDKGEFANAPLAVVSLDSFKAQEEKKKIAAVTFQSLQHGRQWTVAKYGLEEAVKKYGQKEQCNDEKVPEFIENKAREIIKNENLYSDKIEDKYIKEAWEYIKGEEN